MDEPTDPPFEDIDRVKLVGRLRKEGRWKGDAEDWKNAKIKELRRGKVKHTRENASDLAWAEMAAKYRHIPRGNGSVSGRGR